MASSVGRLGLIVITVGMQRLRSAQYRRAPAASPAMLFIGCWAVGVEPPVCVWKRSIIARGSVAPSSFMIFARIGGRP